MRTFLIKTSYKKGHVERAVERVRRRAFCEKQCFKTYEEAVTSLIIAIYKLNKEIKQRTATSASAIFTEEKKFLQPSRIKLDVGIVRTSKVDKYSFIYVDSNYYSVPDYLVGKELMIKKYPMLLRVFYNDKEIFKLNRIYGKNEYKVDITHYIQTLKKKPGAIRNSLALKQSATWLQNIFQNYFNTKPKDFVVLLELINEHSIKSIQNIISELEVNRLNVDLSMIKYHLLKQPITPNEDKKLSDEINEHCLEQLKQINVLHQLHNHEEEVVC